MFGRTPFGVAILASFMLPISALTNPGCAALIQTMEQAETCRTVRVLGGADSQNCQWRFPFRDVLALRFFEDMNAHARSCLKGGSEVLEDRGVNHPDSYRQRRHVLGEVEIAVSLKDKTELQETYVFLNIQSDLPL